MSEVMDIKLWNIDTNVVVTALNDFIEDWRISRNSDLDEFLKSYPGYFSSDEETREAIRMILTYGKELMDGKRKEVDFYEHKIWVLASGQKVRTTHFHERKISKMLNRILEIENNE